MITNDFVQKFKHIKGQIKTGDFITLGRMLGTDTSTAARMRFLRKDVEAVQAMETIIKNRENLIRTYQSKKYQS